MNNNYRSMLGASTETEVLEFKEAKRGFAVDDLGKYFSALSNEANLYQTSEALLFFGVEDKIKPGNSERCVVGTIIDDKKINEWKHEIHNNISPKMSFTDVVRNRIDGKNIIIFKIPPAPRGIPVSWKGHFYAREGESLVALSIEKIERIRKQAQYDWSAEIVPNADLNDLDEDAIAAARKQFSEKNPKFVDEIPKWDDETFLNKSKLLIKGKVTRAAIILLGKPEAESLLSPASAKISWILRDKDGNPRDYEHFSCPFLITIENVYNKIRNLKYRYIANNTLFPDEILRYNPFTIRESLNNCIAHQDYTLGGKINIVEYEDDRLVFQNMGDFIPISIENVLNNDAPESQYRNPFLAQAMVNLNMIDTIGSGIRKLYEIQSKRYFPLPDYDLSNRKVELTITGKILDIAYVQKLAEKKDLTLKEIILLDKVQKKRDLDDDEIKYLRNKSLIEGRKPNLYISRTIAVDTNQENEYIKNKGIDDDYCKKIILDRLNLGACKRSEFEDLLLSRLPAGLSIEQKKVKIRNILQSLRRENRIQSDGKIWQIIQPSDPAL
ncbi:MAG: RNA-binding domain-containing protein [Bradymonadia bacterium]